MNEAILGGLSFHGFRRMFYAVTPSETTFRTLRDVPPILNQSFVWFFILMGLELIVGWVKGKKDLYKLDDSVTSMGGGLLQSLVKVLSRSTSFAAYCWVYENLRVVELAWDWPGAWWLSFLGVDFAYYWFHRMSHEVLLFWSFHQMHHSSEYYNLSTALRQGFVQQYLSMFYYLPLALFLSPTLHLVHGSLNIMYQFWIHTEMIGNLGPLEFFLNTPSHHRVHHGRNPYCIDKNYGGTLIIWDRLFGTFRAEKKEEEVVYGLVHPVGTFDQLYCQLFSFKEALWDKPRSMKTWPNTIQAPFRGPGWQPGVITKDSSEGIPEIVHPVVKYTAGVSHWVSLYVFIHFLLNILVYVKASAPAEKRESVLLHGAFIAVSLQCFGWLLDRRRSAKIGESARTTLTFLYLRYTASTEESGASQLTELWFLISAVMMAALLVRDYTPCLIRAMRFREKIVKSN